MHPLPLFRGVEAFDTVALKRGVAHEEVGMAPGERRTDSKEHGCDMLWQGVPE